MKLLTRSSAAAAMAAALAGAAVAAPGFARTPQVAIRAALTAPVTTRFQTTLQPQYEAGVYTGTMRLTLDPNGVVTGFYTSDDTGRPLVVTGGFDGNNLWLDIGSQYRISGTYRNGRIDGTTQLFPYGHATEYLTFSATPAGS